MPTRYAVASTDDLAENGSRAFIDADGVEIAVFNIEGEFYAMANYCVHQAGPLCEGELRGRFGIGDDGWEWTLDPTEQNVVCPWHGWKFDVTTGKNLNDERYVTPTYEVEVEDETVYVLR